MLPAVIPQPVPEADKDLDSEISSAKAEVERMINFKKHVHAEMERIQAEYRTYFPEATAEIGDMSLKISELTDELALLQEQLDDLEEDEDDDFETFEDEPEESEESEDEPEEEAPEEKKRSNLKSARELFLRISRLSHPDKTSHLSQEERDALKDIFIKALDAYRDSDVVALFDLYAETTAIRKDGLGALEDSKRKVLERLLRSKSRLTAELNELQEFALYRVYVLEQQGRKGEAQATYFQVTRSYLSMLEAQRADLVLKVRRLKERLDES